MSEPLLQLEKLGSLIKSAKWQNASETRARNLYIRQARCLKGTDGFWGDYMRAHLLVLITALTAASAAYASTNELKTELQTRKKFDLSAIIQGESNLYAAGSRDYQAGGRFQIAPAYRINSNLKASATLTILQDMSSPERKTAFANTKLAVSHTPIRLTDDTSLILVGGGRLPTNSDDRREKTYNGGLLTESLLLTQWAPRGFTFTTITGLYLVKNFHTYDRDSRGEVNMDNQAMAYFGVEKYLTPRISLTLDGDYTLATAYNGSRRTLFDIGQSLTYEGDGYSITIGHTNGGDALQANGTDYNVRVFDQNTSVVYANMRFVY